MKFFIKYLMRISKGFFFVYLLAFIVFSFFIGDFIPFISFLLILLVMLYHFFLKYVVKKKDSSSEELELKYKVTIFGTTFLVGLLIFNLNNIFGAIFLFLFLIEVYFLLNNVYISSIKKINYVELFFNTFIISFISFNIAYLFLNIIYFVLKDFRLSILEMIFFYIFPFLFTGFFLRKFFLHIYYTLKKRKISILDFIKLFSNSFKKTFFLFLIIIFVYLLVSSIIYYVFVNRYNNILHSEIDFEEPEDVERYDLIRSDYEFSLPIYYKTEREEISCTSNLSYNFSSVLDDRYLKDIFCAYGRISYLLVADEDSRLNINDSDGLIIKDRDFYKNTFNNIKKNSKVYYLINSYFNFFNSFKINGD